ncbi:DUF4912 domain-containing protein [Microcoleus sp. FACHB-1515]|uniref:DUF4912 domain-containing protein n=1 Tax=Cyanophyceae TaxID=3028117 RepID=UPI001682017F|nr:DUF4912 domain-containing protein [Microcoleus sp. FACHB-1515]MBD2089118.1 DUF4912 domain-containing protein [Microcoleus sp. FACHB-1515]
MNKARKLSQPQRVPFASLAVLLALTIAPAASFPIRPAIAQSAQTTFSLPSTVAEGTTVRVDGSSSMAKINEALKEQFEAQYSGTTVNINTGGTSAALQSLLAGDIDVAAIGRPLTEAEKAQGLVAVPVTRNKIAMIVGPNNPFAGSLTIDQFARMFRGEITNWAQVGGTAGPIRFVDRPETSDTRQAFRNYPVFQNAPFQTGATAITASEDSTDAVIAALGNDGISYAIVDQVTGRSDVKIVRMHDTLPTDPRYPFSQPLLYVYKGPTPNPAAQAFLGYATNPNNRQAVEAARQANAAVIASPAAPEAVSPTASPAAAAAPTAAASPEPTTIAAAPTADADPVGRGAWWLGWLAIPLVGGLLWWLLKDRAGEVAAPIAASGAAAIAPAESRMILTPRNCKQAYAYWEVPDAVHEDFRQRGGRRQMVRLYDVTDIDLNRQSAHSFKQFDCDAHAQDLHVPVPIDNRDYVAELGYLTGEGQWLKVARSSHVRVPACQPSGEPVKAAPRAAIATDEATVRPSVPVAAGIAAGVAAAGVAARSLVNQPAVDKNSRIVLTPRSDKEAYAYWEVSNEHKADLRQQGGQKLMLRVHDATNVDLDIHPPVSTQTFACSEQQQDLHVPIPVSDRDYVAELGYETQDGNWLRLARSTSVHVPSARLQASAATPIPAAAPAGTSTVSKVASLGGAAIATGATATAFGYGKNVSDRGAANRTHDEMHELVVDSRKNCFLIEPDSMARLQQQTAVAKVLQPGVHTITLKSGEFDYRASSGHPGEPIVLLWLYGGRVVNRATNIEVGATWSSLNGLGDQMVVEVRETTTLNAFFFDTHLNDNEGEVTLTVESQDAIDTLLVHSQRNCYYIHPEAMRKLEQETSVSQTLPPGAYNVRIKSGAFGYRTEDNYAGEPIVLLWIYGGKFVNQKTDVEVGATWSSLNGYRDTLKLDVRETTTLCAFFFDTHLEDNEGQVVLSLSRL